MKTASKMKRHAEVSAQHQLNMIEKETVNHNHLKGSKGKMHKDKMLERREALDCDLSKQASQLQQLKKDLKNVGASGRLPAGRTLIGKKGLSQKRSAANAKDPNSSEGDNDIIISEQNSSNNDNDYGPNQPQGVN